MRDCSACTTHDEDCSSDCRLAEEERVQNFLDELAIMEGYEVRRKDGSRVMTTVRWQEAVKQMMQAHNLLF